MRLDTCIIGPVLAFRSCCLASIVAILATAVPGAPAASANPAPDCHGMAFSDPAGTSAPANLDIVGAFFTVGADGEPYANIAVRDLTTAIPPGAAGVMWAVHVVVNGQQGVAYAAQSAVGGLSYGYMVGGDGRLWPGTGALFPGPHGVVQIGIAMPEQGVGVGTTVSEPWAEADELRVTTLFGASPWPGATQVDRAPAAASGVSYTFGSPCPKLQAKRQHRARNHGHRRRR
jgi:hypothetical protein